MNMGQFQLMHRCINFNLLRLRIYRLKHLKINEILKSFFVATVSIDGLTSYMGQSCCLTFLFLTCSPSVLSLFPYFQMPLSISKTSPVNCLWSHFLGPSCPHKISFIKPSLALSVTTSATIVYNNTDP